MNYLARVAGYSLLGTTWWLAFMLLTHQVFGGTPQEPIPQLLATWVPMALAFDVIAQLIYGRLGKHDERWPAYGTCRSLYLIGPLMVLNVHMPSINTQQSIAAYTLFVAWWVVPVSLILWLAVRHYKSTRPPDRVTTCP
jgi:hypothetical protein